MTLWVADGQAERAAGLVSGLGFAVT
jgi:hypothetical protein